MPSQGRRVHLLDPERPPGTDWVMCNLRAMERTDDPSETTCQRCLVALDKAMAGDEPYIAREAKDLARSRALCRLIENHRSEFNALWTEAIPQCRDEVAARRAAFAAYMQRRDEHSA